MITLSKPESLESLAHLLYAKNQTLDMWNVPVSKGGMQHHEKTYWYNLAEDLVKRLKDAGLVIVTEEELGEWVTAARSKKAKKEE